MDQQHQIPPPAQMMQMITGFWTSCCIYAAAKLNVAELLSAKAKTAAQLAEEVHCHAPSLYRVLRALSSTGIFSENANGEFSNTTLSETLKGDVPGSMKAMALAQLGDHYGAWGNLTYSIKTGNIAFDFVEGMPIWKYYETHPEEGNNFIRAMAGLTGAVIMNVLPAYDFSSFKTIVDIGGGNGALMFGILNNAPNAKGIVFDEEYVVNETKKTIAAKGLDSRCTISAGTFFEFVPKDADCYLMKHILHDWDDEKSLQILKNCFVAMKSGSKLLLLESVIPGANQPHPGKFMDINMLTMTGGRERTAEEYRIIIEKAGLKLSQIIYTNSPMFSIVEIIKE
jgi:hypothetical protein